LDGRLSHLHLTDAGMQLYRELIVEVQAVTELEAAGLSPARQQELNTDLKSLIALLPDLR
jgi:DNA-binding MarR family transcriptional regulator